MNQDRTILTNRLGAASRNPSDATLEAAITDLRSHQDDREHLSITLCRGTDAGEMHVLELFADGSITYSHYADCDCDQLLSECRAEALGVLDITRRFRYLRDGDMQALNLCLWKNTN